MSGEAAPATPVARSWWLRASAVLIAPRPVFVSLRDESEEAVEARAEPISAIVGLAGVAAVLGTPVARTLLNDASMSVALIPVWAFLGGAVYALALYWLGGGLLYGAVHGLGSLGSYRRARQTLGLATAPLALTLVTLWPLRIAVYGTDLFRTGGNDYGRTDAVFGGVYFACLAWSAWLLLAGVRATHGWTWGRSAAAAALAAAFPVLVVLATKL